MEIKYKRKKMQVKQLQNKLNGVIYRRKKKQFIVTQCGITQCLNSEKKIMRFFFASIKHATVANRIIHAFDVRRIKCAKSLKTV